MSEDDLTGSGRRASWCEASGSEDAYRPDDAMDTVECNECGRWLHLTSSLQLPPHLTTTSQNSDINYEPKREVVTTDSSCTTERFRAVIMDTEGREYLSVDIDRGTDVWWCVTMHPLLRILSGQGGPTIAECPAPEDRSGLFLRSMPVVGESPPREGIAYEPCSVCNTIFPVPVALHHDQKECDSAWKGDAMTSANETEGRDRE